MRIGFVIFVIILMTIMGNVSHANRMQLGEEQYEVFITDIVLPFLDALKIGDVVAIKHYIAGDIYENKKVLLEKNKEYSAFLKNYYQNVEFYIEDVMESGDYILVNVGIEFSNGNEGNAKLYLGKTMNKNPEALEEATWKIIEFRFK